jgi:hypothetical protein
VHTGISEAEALEQVDLANAYLKSLELERPHECGSITVSIDSYLKCSLCGSPSKDFVPAEEGDAPMLATLPAIIVSPTGDSSK